MYLQKQINRFVGFFVSALSFLMYFVHKILVKNLLHVTRDLATVCSPVKVSLIAYCYIISHGKKGSH